MEPASPSSAPRPPRDEKPDPGRRARQKRIITLLGFALLIGGAIVLFALRRVPLPMRVMAGLTDVIAGLVLLLVARQKF